MLVNEDQVSNDEIVLEQEAIEETDDSENQEPAIIQEEDEDEEDRIVTIGDAPEEEEAEEEEFKPDLVKKLRKVTRGLEKKNKALQRQIEESQKAAQVGKPVELGEKPTLSSCNFDDKKFEQELLNYHDRKRKVDEQAAQKAKEVENQNAVYKTRQDLYVSKKKEHSFRDYSEIEELVTETLSITQQGIIVQIAEDSALLVYALGKNPKKLEELSKIKDPIQYAYELAKLEAQLKVSNRKAPAPETRITGGKSGGISGNSDKKLEQLREKAAKTGDYSEVTAYKRAHRKD